MRGLAEAEAKEKLAHAFEKFGETAVLDIILKMLPELAGQIAAPIQAIDTLTIATDLMATAPEMLKSVSGIDVNQLIMGLTSRAISPEPSNLNRRTEQE
ncbi:putative membrane protein YqiK [Paenibacillus harenae]|nr:putative membrane protein YqiK [Paenibacillus harenae]